MLDIPEVTANLDVEDVKDMDLDINPEAEGVNEVEYIFADAVLDESRGLSVHMKCIAHTFNLVVNVDADEALKSALFTSVYRKSKAQWLWNL